MRFLIKSDCKLASIGPCGVFDVQEVVVGGGLVDVGVRCRMSSIIRTFCGLYGTRPVLKKPF
jgi:hypothetical protein